MDAHEVRAAILADDNPIRRAISVMCFAGLGASEAHAITATDIRMTPPRIPGVSGNGRGLSYAEAKGVMQSALKAGHLRDLIIVEMGLVCALRQIELRRLRVGDLSRRHGRLFATVRGKGGGRREVYVPAPLSDRIEAMLAGEGGHMKKLGSLGGTHVSRYLFQSNTGGQLSANGIRWLINKHLKTAAPHATAHGLRHTCVTWLLNSGATLEQAMEIAGHTEAGSHEIYAAVDDGWFIEHWRRTHPIADWGVGVCHLYVAGKPYMRRMARGTERVVPIPCEAAEIILEGIGEAGSLSGIMSKKMMTWIYRELPYNPRSLRKAAAVGMAEEGAHPFLISLILGITPDQVLERGFDRLGRRAEEERVTAVDRAIARLYQDDNASLDAELHSA